VLVALGISGGIAAYKAQEIVRALDKAGVEVQVLLTEHACEFVTPLTLQTLSRRRVMIGQYDLDEQQTIQHIELTRRVAALVVAPATANILAKLARGVADDLLSTFYTAVTVPVVVAPAMNTRMWLHPSTQSNLAELRARGVTVIEPDSGWLAEGETGTGRMAEPARIAEIALQACFRSRQLAGKTVVVTAGPTREPVDPVRFVSNRSSGKMGYALAAAAARRGARVVLISGPVALPMPYGVELVRVHTSAEMETAVEQVRDGAEAVFMAAAVSDYLPSYSPSKIKKSEEKISWTLERGPDILARLGKDRRERVLVGFAAETESLIANATEKLERKGADFIAANDVSRPDIGMESDDNAVTIIGRDGEQIEVPKASKAEVAEAILDRTLGKVPVEELP